jgi:hypothetical protein
VCVCVCIVRYPAWNAHAPYYDLWSLLHFFTLYNKGHDIREDVTENKNVLIFASTLSEKFLILGRNERDIIINVHRSLCKLPFSCHIVMKLEFSRHISEKSSNIKFYENLSSWSRVVPCGQTDMKRLIIAFRNFAKAPRKSSYIYTYIQCTLHRNQFYHFNLVPNFLLGGSGIIRWGM